jgi:hypothetical protein
MTCRKTCRVWEVDRFPSLVAAQTYADMSSRRDGGYQYWVALACCRQAAKGTGDTTMTWNRHEQFLHMTESELIAFLRQQGFVRCREHFICGRMLMFADVESGVKKYYVAGGLRDWPEVAAYLRENWRPPGQEEATWFERHLSLP